METEKFWLGFWAVAGITIVSIVITICVWSYKRDCKFIAEGYTRQTLQGSSLVEWVKDDKTLNKE